VHNVNVGALQKTIATAKDDATAVRQTVGFSGEWQTGGGPQFRATIQVPNGDPVTFQADFPPPMGGTGSAPNPLAYCFWGGMACYAMTLRPRGRQAGRRAARPPRPRARGRERALGSLARRARGRGRRHGPLGPGDPGRGRGDGRGVLHVRPVRAAAAQGDGDHPGGRGASGRAAGAAAAGARAAAPAGRAAWWRPRWLGAVLPDVCFGH
jgi:hypothetical protein